MIGEKWRLIVIVAALVSAATVAVAAAPISGSFTMEFVFQPACSDEIPGNDNVSPFPNCDKIDDLLVKVEADLLLTLAISGLDIASTTVFTFKGLESQTLLVGGTIGALIFRDTFIFAPSLVEVELVRSALSLSPRYCINMSTPGDLTPPFLDCPSPDATLYYLLENVGLIHPAVANLTLANIFDSADMLNAPLELAKKIVEININIAGLSVFFRGLFANFSTGQPASQTRSWQTGIVIGLEGQTVSGMVLRTETWFGARQGLECWGECKPLERNYGGKVVSTFSAQEEKIFIRNLNIAGIIHSFRIEFKFGQANPADNGLSFFEWNMRFRLTPFGAGLSMSNTLRIDGSLMPKFDIIAIDVNYGNTILNVIWYIYPDAMGDWQSQIAEIITTIDPPGATITSDLTFCTETLFVISCTAGVVQHDIIVSAAVNNLTVNLTLKMLGMLSGFAELWIDGTWQVGIVSFKASLAIAADYVEAIGFAMNVRF